MGGGWSLNGFSWKLLHLPNVCILNRAILDLPFADNWYGEDIDALELFQTELNRFKGRKIFHARVLGSDDVRARLYVPDIEIITTKRKGKFWSTSVADGLTRGQSSAVAAVNFLELMGASEIYLFGMDAKLGPNGEPNYHDSYPPNMRSGRHQCESFQSEWENWVKPNCKTPIVNVINPMWPSALTCFPLMTYREFQEKFW